MKYIIDLLIPVQKVLELVISVSNTGDKRNKLCDLNIELLTLIQKYS